MEKDFWAKCNMCGTEYLNWSGSTPCCGSIAYIVEDDVVTNKLSLFASTSNSNFEPAVIEIKS